MLKINKKLSFWALGLLALVGCDLQKENKFNRQMQNLTAHYNIIFNANQIIAQKQAATAVSFVDAYDRFLSVYPDTAAQSKIPDKDLVSVVTRANTIIRDKSQSHYLGDAYLILGKANYLQTNFFNAIEFFNYVVRSYPKQKNLVQEARVWKTRSLMRINQMLLADTTIDTALQSIFPKEKNIADIYATRLQFDLYAAHYVDGEEMAKQAIKYSGDINHKLRWTYILAQLQEQNHKSAEAVANYTRVVNSNASFEMAFNASLSCIRIAERQNGEKLTRIQLLRKLLKDDKNKDFIDQIYFQIGDQYLTDGKIDLAILNFKLSVRKSTKNLNQKGLSYLRLADINFKNKANYPLAKKYYDSTLTSLSPNYPGYAAIFKKSSNLQLLTDRLTIIAHEDTLQMLARLDPATRDAKIKAMAKAEIDAQKTIADNAANAKTNNTPFSSAAVADNYASTFYFYNASAVSQGFTDFKRVWGSRPLGDNWRRSVKTPTETNNAQVASTIQSLNASSLPNKQKSTNDVIADKMQQDITQSLPLTPQQVEESNMRILNAYVDIANFYRDVLDDRKEAIATFELILKRFPNNAGKASDYYNLYRLYNDIDPAKSDYYKNLILKEYPESNFAKVIQDPDFNQKLNDRNAEYTAFYNQLFDMVLKRNYKEAATRAGELIAQYPDNALTPQVYYLRAIALGHTQTVDPFRLELQEIVNKFPADRLITPLVKQHLQFIDANQADLKQREIVLVDSDPNEIPFLLRSIHVDDTYRPNQFVAKQPMPAPAKTASKPVTTSVPAAANPAVPAKVDAPKEAPSIFSLRDSTNYYFVISVSTNTVSLAPSRFGIGQFNRSNLPQGTLVKHQLKAVGTNQLIYVGRFTSLYNAKDYARAIIPLLPQIMKVPADKYKFFIITQENLDKLADQKTLDSYFDFYQKKY